MQPWLVLLDEAVNQARAVVLAERYSVPLDATVLATTLGQTGSSVDTQVVRRAAQAGLSKRAARAAWQKAISKVAGWLTRGSPKQRAVKAKLLPLELGPLYLAWGVLVSELGYDGEFSEPSTGLPQKLLYLSAQQRCQAPKKTEALPVLDEVGTWPAASPVDPQHVTLVTQLSLERLNMLENQCEVWPHALAAAVYVPLLKELVVSLDSPALNGIRLAQALEMVGNFHARLQSEGACNLQLALFAERCSYRGLAGLYPFNAMRNKALQMVQTEVVFQLDADFVVSNEFGEEVGSPAGWAALRQQLALAPAVIVPAFEPNATQLQRRQKSKQRDEGGDRSLARQLRLGKSIAFKAAKAGKGWVAAKYAARELQQSAIDKFEAGHNCTQYSRWLGAQDYYEVPYAEGYEPYTVMLRQHVPWFDERFRGYGYDKMIGYLVMWHWGIRFAVHPRAFVVHVPHAVAKTLALTKQLKQHSKLRQMFLDATEDLGQQQYVPVTSFPDQCPLQHGGQQ
ncbi:hypothetical protein N2152v2_008479 [Parachlorella kessleri]